MSQKALIEVLDSLCRDLPGSLCSAIFDIAAGDLLVIRFGEDVEDDGELDIAISGAAIAHARLANAHAAFDSGPPSRLTCDTGQRHVCAQLIDGRFLAVIVGQAGGASGLSASLLDARAVPLSEALEELALP